MKTKQNALELINKMIDKSIKRQDKEDYQRLQRLHTEIVRSIELINQRV